MPQLRPGAFACGNREPCRGVSCRVAPRLPFQQPAALRPLPLITAALVRHAAGPRCLPSPRYPPTARVPPTAMASRRRVALLLAATLVAVLVLAE